MNLSRVPRSRGRRALGCGVLIALGFVAGCGEGQGLVSGKVLYKGKALPGGFVMFRPARAGQNTVTAAIDENGLYQASLPVGESQIAVENRELQTAAGSADPSAGIRLPAGVKEKVYKGGSKRAATPPDGSERIAGTYVPIPSRYYDVRSSGLSYTVRSGPQPFDIELK
jgi:hypothetical protein